MAKSYASTVPPLLTFTYTTVPSLPVTENGFKELAKVEDVKCFSKNSAELFAALTSALNCVSPAAVSVPK